MSAPVTHGARRNSLLGLCFALVASQLLGQVFVAPFAGLRAGRPRSTARAAMALDEVEVGSKYEGKVVNVKPFGAFVDFGCESQGLVHISALKEGFVDNIFDEVVEGQDVEVWVKGIDGNNKISLTMVEGKLGRPKADLTPFEPLVGGEQISGIVKAVKDFGAFVEVEVDGQVAQGLVHKSRLSNEFVDDVFSVVSEGDEVQVTVQAVDNQNGKLDLSMKTESDEQVDLTPFEPLVGGEQISGIVKAVKDFGAFVEVEVDGQVAQGLVHKSRLSNEFVDDVFSVVSEGDEVQVTVQAVDMEKGKLDLSMKTESDEQEDGEQEGDE